ncbi:MAG: cupin domain-containing protein [Nostoc sp.]|uniref:cupin domain-containing protein n=1 Tax=Nostoc sp. TaxID=1180 RepID=UPI002FF8EA90
MSQQTFIQTDLERSLDIEQFPGAKFFPLAEPVSQGSIHLLTMKAGTMIPIHTHPCDEYVYVMKGFVETAGKTCSAGIFWFTPAHIQQGPHIAITNVEILTIRLGPIGVFESSVADPL